jgi:hypothetical protein
MMILIASSNDDAVLFEWSLVRREKYLVGYCRLVRKKSGGCCDDGNYYSRLDSEGFFFVAFVVAVFGDE